MGRKPNLLIQEFFERGAKLDDQSNRYQHTCKKCGMFFPKGRPDGMNRHLFEKCPNITDYDKARAFAFAQGQMDTKKIAQRLGRDAPQSQGPPMHQHPPSFQPPPSRTLQPPSIPPAPPMVAPAPVPAATLNREPSALDTLAEVAAMPSQEQPTQQEPTHEMDQWMIQLQQQLNDASSSGQDGAPQNQTSTREEETKGSSQLVQTASAASELHAHLDDETAAGAEHSNEDAMNQEEYRGFEALRAHIQSDQNRTSNLDPALEEHQSLHASATLPQSGLPRNPSYSFQFPTDDAMQTTAMQGYGLLSRPSKRQRRNKFSTERRKEVGGIRKLGACLRCRMLKKPCSGETPCSTCRVIGNPRLWRTTCVRTRLADEFSLYNTPYFFARGTAAVGSLASGKPAYAAHGRLEVCIGSTDTPITFSVLQIDTPGDERRSGTALDNTSLALKVETEESVSSVDNYLSSALSTFHSLENQPLLHSTISYLASAPADILVARTLHLHAATTILCAPQDLHWSLVYVLPNEDGQTETPHHLSTSRPDFPVLQAQTLDAIERFAGQTFKHVANELERRLLARTTSTPLTTYLVTVLLLNCVERMSLLFRRFDQREHIHTNDIDAEHLQTEQDMAAAGEEWPLSKPPRHYVTQAASFGGLCGMLLRMRQLVPRTVVKTDDSLAVIRTQGRKIAEVLPYTAEDETMLGPERGESEKDKDKERFLREVAGWLRSTGLKTQEVLSRTRLTDDDVGEGWKAWDMRFVGGLVLPEGYGEAVGPVGGQVQKTQMRPGQEVRFWNSSGEMVDPALGRAGMEGMA
ncbi:hypothetical protein KVT40_005333 [Elsinoe batatas]|uniref:Uncharacterized protein n=1 Tax=Elsinoe batatas TaxID=2601811 RepID=A0A8K0L1B5_9PEZI|nr:hypothetical protein KVT40_005333 [Elsinoe batatas]